VSNVKEGFDVTSAIRTATVSPDPKIFIGYTFSSVPPNVAPPEAAKETPAPPKKDTEVAVVVISILFGCNMSARATYSKSYFNENSKSIAPSGSINKTAL